MPSCGARRWPGPLPKRPSSCAAKHLGCGGRRVATKSRAPCWAAPTTSPTRTWPRSSASSKAPVRCASTSAARFPDSAHCAGSGAASTQGEASAQAARWLTAGTGAGNQAAQRVCTCVPADPVLRTSVRDLETSPWQPEPPGPGRRGPGFRPRLPPRGGRFTRRQLGRRGASSVPPGRRSQRPSQRQSCDRSVPRSHEAWRPCAPAGLACRGISARRGV